MVSWAKAGTVEREGERENGRQREVADLEGRLTGGLKWVLSESENA